MTGGRQKLNSVAIGMSALFAALLSGCISVTELPEEAQVLLNRSAIQTLRIKNTHNSALSILACESGGPSIALPQGGHADLAFRVVAVADLRRPESPGPWSYEMASTAFVYPEPENQPCYLKPGVDSVVALERPDGLEDKILFNFQGCPPDQGWQDVIGPEATHAVDSVQPPIPIRLCPQ